MNLFQRADDNEETAKNRIDVYNKETAPLVDYYEKAGMPGQDRWRGTAGRNLCDIVQRPWVSNSMIVLKSPEEIDTDADGRKGQRRDL